MSTYALLYDYLQKTDLNKITMTFFELEQVLGFILPRSACTYSAWWANGGHSHAHAWLDAGYKVERIDLRTKTVSFYKHDAPANREAQIQNGKVRHLPFISTELMPIDPSAETLSLHGYVFHFVQLLKPECSPKGHIVKYYPQDNYHNKNGLRLSLYGEGAFCRFSIDAGEWPGVYLWVVDGLIIYIGQTAGLRRRFNMGYGNISPRNCYVGGQSTNCKMNKIVLRLHEQGKAVSLFFHYTTNYKFVEVDLLGKIKTPYNKINN